MLLDVVLANFMLNDKRMDQSDPAKARRVYP